MERAQVDISQVKINKPELILWISLSIIFVLFFLSTYLIKIPFKATTFRFIELIILMLTAVILLRYYDFRIESTQLDGRQKESLKLKIDLWVILSIIIGLTFLLAIFCPTIPSTAIAFTFLFVELICLLLFSIKVLKYYDLYLVCFLIIFFGLFVKRIHYNLAAEEMTIGTVSLSVISLFNSGKFLISFRNNTFLKWFGFLAGIIITLFMMGMLYLNLHWSGKIRDILISSGCFLFIIYVFALVFTLPNSNYISWSNQERKIFFRAVLIPMVFIFALITLIIVFPDTYNIIMGREGIGISVFPYEINTIKLFNLEGILII
ncbi:MAG: hypothetical protein ABSA76_01430 [Bacteroidales bacterium]